MSYIFIPTIGERLELRNDGRQTFEVLSGETVVISPALEIEQLSGTGAAIEDQSIAPAATGVSTYSLTNADGEVSDLRLFTCESACLTKIGAAIALGPSTGEPDTSLRRRRILRSIVNDRPSWFTGAAATLANRNLAPYGAA